MVNLRKALRKAKNKREPEKKVQRALDNIKKGFSEVPGDIPELTEEDKTKPVKKALKKEKAPAIELKPVASSGFAVSKKPKDLEEEMKSAAGHRKKTSEYASVNISEEIKSPKGAEFLKEWTADDLSTVDETYPLVKRDEEVFAQARVVWDNKSNELRYILSEPPLDMETEKLLHKLESLLIDRLEIGFVNVSQLKAEDFLLKEANELTEFYGIKFTPQQRKIVEYYLFRNFIGHGKIEPVIQDGNIEDISCDGLGIPIYIYHRNPKYGSIRTNLVFTEREKLDAFVMKLAQRCGRAISVAEPLLDGTLPDGSRVQATFGSDISRKGPTFTIRKFMHNPLTPVDLINYGTIDEKMLSYLWLALEHGKSLLVAGATATGKTAMLNALSLFIPPDRKIVSIEDTAELRLPHENWLPQVARTGFGAEKITGKRMGEVDMFDLVKASLRQRPDYIIVGEVRGKEAYVLFQSMATGHTGMSTIHADTIEGLINRLETKPISLPASLLQNLDIVMIIAREKLHGSYVRRVKRLVEIVGYDMKSGELITNDVFNWVPSEDKFTYAGKSHMLGKLIEERGANELSMQREIERRMSILRWMKTHNYRFYGDVSKYINMYYRIPKQLVELVGND